MLKYLENSEVLKVSTREVKEQVLCPNEPSANIVCIARQVRSEKSKKLFQIFSRQGANEIPVASMARWEEHLVMLVVLERECLALSQKGEHLNEKQEVLAILMEGKLSMQKVAPEKYKEKMFEELKELEEKKTRIGTGATQAQVSKMGG